MLHDYRGHRVSGSSPRALELYESALAEHLACRGDPGAQLARALAAAPEFVTAHVLRAYLALGGREPQGATAARDVLRRVERLPATRRERLHLEAVRALAAQDVKRASRVHDTILADYPCDVLALQVAHFGDYVRGDARSLLRRVCRVLPAWSAARPNYHAVLAMHAFALEECGHYARAEAVAREALELNPWDVRAHHAVVHVHEMRGDAAAGMRWAGSRMQFWSGDSPAAIHNWWHVALFQIAAGRPAGALAVYDRRIRPHLGRARSVLIDASALLWRLHLQGFACGERAEELAARWTPRTQDAHSVFSDLHAMMAFAAAGRGDGGAAVLGTLRRRAMRADEEGALARLVGLPACRALAAFGARRWNEAVTLLRELPALAQRLGGSRAQQGVLALTLTAAAQRAG